MNDAPHFRTTDITITPVEQTLWRAAWRQIVFWSILIAVNAASYWLTGGSWAIEVLTIFAAAGIIVVAAVRLIGIDVKMTKRELSDWVDAGMPDNVVEWRRLRYDGSE